MPYAMAAWHNGQRNSLLIRRSWLRVPPGFYLGASMYSAMLFFGLNMQGDCI
jgi:hypothetical protein